MRYIKGHCVESVSWQIVLLLPDLDTVEILTYSKVFQAAPDKQFDIKLGESLNSPQ